MISKDAIDETIALDDCAMFQCKQGNKQFDIHTYAILFSTDSKNEVAAARHLIVFQKL